MKFKSVLLAMSSGSVGGATFSHNKGGMYIRRRATPTNPNSTRQAAVRAIMADLANRWNNTLSAAQRTAWNTYASNVKVPNAFGDLVYITGLNHYVRSNVPAIQAWGAGGRKDAAPTTFNVGDYTYPVFAADQGTNLISVTFKTDDDWAGEPGASMNFYVSVGQNPSINYFKGPYQRVNQVWGNAPPPASPYTFDPGFAIVTGNKLFIRSNVCRADGRLSFPFLGGCTCT